MEATTTTTTTTTTRIHRRFRRVVQSSSSCYTHHHLYLLSIILHVLLLMDLCHCRTKISGFGSSISKMVIVHPNPNNNDNNNSKFETISTLSSSNDKNKNNNNSNSNNQTIMSLSSLSLSLSSDGYGKQLRCFKLSDGRLLIKELRGDGSVVSFYSSEQPHDNTLNNNGNEAQKITLHVRELTPVEINEELKVSSIQSLDIDGIYGIYNVPSGLVLALIVSSEEVYKAPLPKFGTTPLMNVRKVKRIELVTIPIKNARSAGVNKAVNSKTSTGAVSTNPSLLSTDSNAEVILTSVSNAITNREEARQVMLLRKSLKEHDFYFTSYDFSGGRKKAMHDIATNRLQNYFQTQHHSSISTEGRLLSAPYMIPDSRFFWNEEVVRALDSTIARRWVLPCTSAFVGVATNIPFQKSQSSSQKSKEGSSRLLESLTLWFAGLFTSNKVGVDPGIDADHEGLVYDQLLISRRSRFRAGTRFTRRGADDTGAVANYAESEQIIFVKRRGKEYTYQAELLDVHSHVQTRGSIPLLWSSPAHVTTYTPKVRIGKDPLSQARALRQHVFDQLKIYGGYDYFKSPPKPVYSSWEKFPRDEINRKTRRKSSPKSALTIINLIDKHGDQGKLGDTLDSVLHAVLDIHDGIETKGDKVDDGTVPLKESVNHVWFDFHAECRKSNGGWNKLSHLIELVEDEMENQGYLSIVPSQTEDDIFDVIRIQTGSLRTNCMDCLDRTNVVQSILARKALFWQLRQRSTASKQRSMPLQYIVAFTKKDPLHLPWTEGELAHRLIWADNADAISNLYAGTNALKRDYTRTGQRTKRGALDDGVNSVTRFYINNFIDAERQEGVDLVTGTNQFSNVKEVSDVSLDHPNPSEGTIFRSESRLDNEPFQTLYSVNCTEGDNSFNTTTEDETVLTAQVS